MQPQNRRCFVKRSLASSAALTAPAFFSGLIRAHGEGGETTTTDPWDTTAPETTGPADTTIETTYDPFETTVETTDGWETTESSTDTTAPNPAPEPALRKEPATGAEQKIEDGAAMGTVLVRDKAQPLIIKWEGKVFWHLETKLEIPPPETVDGQWVPKKLECFSCTANAQLSLKVVQAQGQPDDTMAKAITRYLNKQLGSHFNGDPQKPYVAAGPLVNGVSAAALLNQSNGLVEIATDNPPDRSSPPNLPLRLKLTPTVVPPDNCHSKGVGWTSEAIGFPDKALIIDGLTGAAASAVEEVDPQLELKSFAVPDNPQFTPPTDVERSQLGLGGMAVNPKPGDTCHLPPP